MGILGMGFTDTAVGPSYSAAFLVIAIMLLLAGAVASAVLDAASIKAHDHTPMPLGRTPHTAETVTSDDN